MMQAWSDPVPYDLSRTRRRASVPKKLAVSVPERPGTYAIYRIRQASVCDAVIDVGEAGPRSNSTPKGLRGRLATTVAHAASEKIASDINGSRLPDELHVVWVERQSKEDARELQNALITLFHQECGRQPRYNIKLEHHPKAGAFLPLYTALKTRIESDSCPPTTRCS